MDESLDALRAQLDRAAPARTLVLTPQAGQARWLARLLLDAGPLVGGHFSGLEGLIDGCARATFGPPARALDLLEATGAALRADPTFERIHTVRRYRQLVLELFAELERSSGPEGPPRGVAATARDEALLAAFARFRRGLGRATRGRWWAGDAPRRVLDAAAEIPLLRDRAGALALGWRSERPWEAAALDALGAERWPVPFATAPEQAPARRLACASAEVEVAAVSRYLRSRDRGAGPIALVVPGDELPWWVTRLGHRDIPVRAWLARPAAATAAARTFEALVRVLGTDRRVDRRELGALLMGPSVDPWPVIAEQLRRWHALPGELSEGTIAAAWRRLRRGSGTLLQWEQRLEAARLRTAEELRERGRRRELPEAETAGAVERWEAAHRALAAAVRALDAVEDAGGARALLLRWGYGRGEPTSLDPEHVAASTVLEVLGRLAELPLERAAPAVSAALEGAVRGTWVDEGPDPVWVMAYSEVPPLLLDRVVMAGLERVPAPPRPGPLLSDAAREALGFGTSFQAFEETTELLESLADAPEVLASWRTRDAAGAACPPGPWIAARPGPPPIAVGLDALSPSPERAPCCALEQAVLAPRGALAWRVAAIGSHERPEVGPHTGDLGLRPPGQAPYTISTLQAYARNPYACFLTRLLGLEAATAEAGDALDALEQGSLVHRALELGARGGLEAGPLDVRSEGRALWERTRAALAEAFREAGEGVLATPVWRGELERWYRELGAWWRGWAARLATPVEADPGASEEAVRQLRASWSSPGYQRARAWQDLRSSEDPRRWRAIVDSGVFGRSWYRTRGAEPLLAGEADPAALEALDRRAARDLAAADAAVAEVVGRVAEAQAVAPGGRVLAVELSLGEEGCLIDLGAPGAPRPARLVGRVDRLEWDAGRDRLVICDYKSGEPPRTPLPRAIASGEHLQLPLYAAAVERLGAAGGLPGVPADAVPPVGMLRLEYLRRRKGEGHVAMAVAPGEPVGRDEQGTEYTAAEAAARFARAFIDGMEAGWFPCVDRGTPSSARLAQAMRYVPTADERDPELPAPLEGDD